tara:strand:+ start:442 stop:1179 length:738 start_codon:yes stop_codon:yes gene_type:complete
MKSIIDPLDHLIIALDGMDREEALSFISTIPEIKWVKVGLELFVCCGPKILSELRDLGLHVFLDLKFHDIPATMSGVCKQAAKHGVELITVHACAGEKALLQAQMAANCGAQAIGLDSPTLLAVTVLTSWDQKDFSKELFIDQTLQSRSEMLTKLAYNSGLGGCICSPLEVNQLRLIYPEPFEFITPGIRLSSGDMNDQVRVLGPCEALEAGASRLVVGRPITKSQEPYKAFHLFLEDIKKYQRA